MGNDYILLCVNWGWLKLSRGTLQAGKTLELSHRKEFSGNSGKCLSWILLMGLPGREGRPEAILVPPPPKIFIGC